MIEKRLEPWKKRLFLNRISVFMIVITAVLSAIVILVSIYGNNVGNFVISVDDTTKLSMSLSEKENFSDGGTNLLNATGLKHANNATLLNIPEDIDTSGEGNKNDINRKYTAYTFYVKNATDIAISYNMTIDITAVTRGVDEAIRVMVYTNGVPIIYAKPRADGTPEAHADIQKPYDTVPFESATTVCDVDTAVFSAGEQVRYTVVLWLEGEDEQCNNSILGGSIKLAMKFNSR